MPTYVVFDNTIRFQTPWGLLLIEIGADRGTSGAAALPISRRASKDGANLLHSRRCCGLPTSRDGSTPLYPSPRPPPRLLQARDCRGRDCSQRECPVGEASL